MPYNPAPIPSEVDCVVLVSDDVDRFLTKYVRDTCERELMPLIYTKSDLTNFTNAVSKAVEVVTKCEERSMVDYFETLETQEEVNMARKTDGRSNGKNTQKAMEKVSYLRELLAQDAKAPTDTVQTKIAKRFGKALTPTTIAQVRWAEFGVKFGPRGKLITKGNEAPKVQMRPRTESGEAMVTHMAGPAAGTNDRLTAALTSLRALMKEANVSHLDIPLSGNVRAVQEVSQEVQFSIN